MLVPCSAQSPTSPWWEARPAALPDSTPASWPALHGCHGNPTAYQQSLLLLSFISLRGQSHFREAPGAARQKGDSPEAPQGPGPRPGLDPHRGQGMTRASLVAMEMWNLAGAGVYHETEIKCAPGGAGALGLGETPG